MKRIQECEHTLLAYSMNESSCVTVPEAVITELCWYVVLDSLSINSLLHLKCLSGGVG